jgi:hypothetical protein
MKPTSIVRMVFPLLALVLALAEFGSRTAASQHDRQSTTPPQIVSGESLTGGSVTVRPKSAAMTVTGSGHGLRVTLTVAAGTFPRDALVVGRVRVDNTSNAPINLRGPVPTCGANNPWLEVVGGHGRRLYPPALKSYFQPPCKVTPAISIEPGQSLVRRQYAILRASRIRAAVTLAPNNLVVTSALLRVHLSSEPKPKAALKLGPNGPRVVISSASGQHGRLMYESSARCHAGGGLSLDVNTLKWKPGRKAVIHAGCLSPIAWHAVAGWLNGPVVDIDYAP